VRIKNVGLGYTIPANIASRANIAKCRVYANVSNLWTFTKYTGYDPEVFAFGQNSLLQGIDYGGYPLARTFQGGVQLTF
jgi:hypothetical protein